MWLLTTCGFFSIVAKPGDAAHGRLTVRARAASDLDRLRAQHLPELGPTVRGGGTDYPFRAHAPREAVARAAASLVAQLDYANFKGRVDASDPGRAHVYGGVWAELQHITEGAPR